MSAPLTLEVLGITIDGEIAYQFSSPNGISTEVMTLTADDLGVLAREIHRDTLPLWPTRPCSFCGTDSVVMDEGNQFCEPHAAAWVMREQEGSL